MIVAGASIYAASVVIAFGYGVTHSYRPIPWRPMFLAALVWPIFLPMLINANRGS